MDYSQVFVGLQGVLVSADNVHSFSRLSAKGGNESKFEYVIACIRKFLEEQNLISKSGDIQKWEEVRKLALFLIMSSDLHIINDMTDIDEIECIIWMLPQITKCLLCEIFWSLNFDKIVYEIIAFCNPELSLELATAFIDFIKYFTPKECLNKIKIIAGACYRATCRLHYFKYHDNVLSGILRLSLVNFQKCLNYFTEPPKVDKLNTMSKDDQYKYKGDCLYTMLMLICDCLEQFTELHEVYPSDIGELYTWTHMRGTTLNEFNFKPCESSCKLIMDCLEKYNLVLLDKSQQLVMDVSVDIFCAWSEFEENNKSMQQKIGESCYHVRTKLVNVNSMAEHPVVNMLQQIACKPPDLTDIIKNSDSETIIDSINNESDTRSEWLQALIQKENLCQDTALLNYLSSNIEFLNEEGCMKLFKLIKSYLNDVTEHRPDLESLSIKAFHHCSAEDKQEILAEHFNNRCFVDMPDTDKFHDMLTERFNKLIESPDTDLTDILTLFLQSPRNVYMKIFNLAAENNQQLNIMLKVMNLLENYSNHYYSVDTEPCIILVTQKTFEILDTEDQINNYIKFICELKNVDHITPTKLLMLVIMPHLHKALLDKNINNLYIQSKLLKEAYRLEELSQYKAPLLAMLAQVLDVVRWKINTFNLIAPATLQLVLQMQTSLLNTYTNGIPVCQARWIKSKIKNLHPLNMYYYRTLWNPPGQNFAEIISGKRMHNKMDTEKLATWLSKIICSSIQEEWCEMWDSLTVFSDAIILNIFHDALSLLTIAEGANRTPESWACLLYCYRLFVYIIRYKFFKENVDDVKATLVADKIAITVNLMEENSIEDLGTVLLPLFSYMAERKNDYKTNISHYLNNKLRHARFADTIKTLFTNGTVD